MKFKKGPGTSLQSPSLSQKHVRNFCHTAQSHIHLMQAIARTHASTHATSMMDVKSNMCHFCLTLIVWDIGIKEMKQRTKISN